MGKQIKLAVLYPNHLNLNGDAANFDVLKKRLEWYNVEASIHSIEKPTDMSSYDFVLLGHGSSLAWAQLQTIDKELIPQIASLVKSGKAVMAVSSGYEILLEEINGTVTKHAERKSEFRDVAGVVGYVNSEALLPEISWVGNSLLTLFHGPVFAKNPDLADRFLGEAIQGVDKNSNVELVDKLASASRQKAFED